MNDRLALVFAGGRGERLGGVDKARLRIGGATLLTRVLSRLRNEADAVFIARAPGSPPLASTGHSVIFDSPDGPQGPVAALSALVAATRDRNDTTLVLTTAVDTPLLPLDFAERGRMALGPAGVAVGRFAGRLYPTQAVWRLGALREALARTAGEAAPALHALLPADTQQLAYDGTENPFANINTLADLRALAGRIREA